MKVSRVRSIFLVLTWRWLCTRKAWAASTSFSDYSECSLYPQEYSDHWSLTGFLELILLVSQSDSRFIESEVMRRRVLCNNLKVLTRLLEEKLSRSWISHIAWIDLDNLISVSCTFRRLERSIMAVPFLHTEWDLTTLTVVAAGVLGHELFPLPYLAYFWLWFLIFFPSMKSGIGSCIHFHVSYIWAHSPHLSLELSTLPAFSQAFQAHSLCA